MERSFDHKERVGLKGATIEHILPQEMSTEWKRELGADVGEAKQLLHTLGNLTLTGYNPELSNKPYAVKRAKLIKSHFELNRHFAEVDRWTPDAIRARGDALARRALRIWKDVGRSSRLDEAKPTGSLRPVRVRFRGVDHPVATWKDAYITLLTQFDAASPGLLNKLATGGALGSVLAFDENRFPRSKERIGLVYVNTNAGAPALWTWVRKVAAAAGIGSHEYEYVLPDASRPAE